LTAPPRIRVAVAVPRYGTIGGGEKFVYELTERLARDTRYEIHVFANQWVPGPGPVTYHKVARVRFPRFLRPLGFAWLAGRSIARGRFDIVHAHDRLLHADVFTMHAVPHAGWIRDVRRKRPGLLDRATIDLERRMMEKAGKSWFLPVSSLAAEALGKAYRVDPARMRVVHPGVDVERFSGPDRAACRAEIRARHGIGPADLVILFVGMNFEVKGLDAIIEAVARARRERPEAGFRLLVVGKGDARRYGNLARSRGIAGAVAFAGPQAAAVERYYRASDAFAMLSRFDTFGMAALEAMAAGLPVILGANVGARDLVTDGENGFVVAGGEGTSEVARRLLALADGQARARMGERAAETAARHTWDATASAVEEVYERVLRDARGGVGG